MARGSRYDFPTTRKHQGPTMPRFAANLGHMFTERPLLERFGAAAAAGFSAVELQFPYDTSSAAVKAELAKHGLTQLGVNTPQGPEFGLAALPGRERDFDAAFARALDYVTAIGGGGRRESRHHGLDRADQSARPAGLFPEPCRARRRSDRQNRRAERKNPVR